ncbi:hypothetical protein E4U42_003936 [Claviceps africana]|uniref:Exonuclease domain-containing protein n=1 Tax=Claviceps africana TaxID=83212 RepID=A0A8K0J669_9HYPO|nr:hypothetical protein E4U42_003936 [Claviceps africana]
MHVVYPFLDASSNAAEEVAAEHPQSGNVMYPESSHGPAQPTAEALRQLQSSSHSLHELKKAGYILHQLPAAELERKERCDQCCKVLGAAPSDATTRDVVDVDGADSGQRETETAGRQKTDFICKFHPGRVVNRARRDQHVPHQYKAGELEKNWRLYETPNTPLASHVAAVVIDCEMGTASSGESELIRISVVDYFTGAVLIDKLVYPSVRMAHYNTRFSGVTRSAMEEARRRNSCFLGRDAARKAVYKFVAPDTVVVGHGANGDLLCLRWIHRVIVDTLLIETNRRQLELLSSGALEDSRSTDTQQEAAGADNGTGVEGTKKPVLPKEGGLSLKSLALKRLDRVIQVKGRGHDSLEDARATRDLLHWYMANPFDMEA